MYFDYKQLNEFSQKDFEEIKSFTYHDGQARPILEKAAKQALTKAKKYTLLILRHDYGFIIGWGLIIPPKDTMMFPQTSKDYSYMCFVRPLWRKKGLGQKIFQEALKQFKNKNDLLVYGWNDKSKSFYSKIKEEFADRKNVVIL